MSESNEPLPWQELHRGRTDAERTLLAFLRVDDEKAAEELRVRKCSTCKLRLNAPDARAAECASIGCHLMVLRAFKREQEWVGRTWAKFWRPREATEDDFFWLNQHLHLYGCVSPALLVSKRGLILRGHSTSGLRGWILALLYEWIAGHAGATTPDFATVTRARRTASTNRGQHGRALRERAAELRDAGIPDAAIARQLKLPGPRSIRNWWGKREDWEPGRWRPGENDTSPHGEY